MTDTVGQRKHPGPGGPFAGALRLLGRVELAITVAAFCGVVSLVTAQVTFRYLFDIGLVWVQEISQLMILVAYFFGTSFVFEARQYLIISILFDRFNERVKLPLYLAAQILTTAFCIMLVVELLRIAPNQLYMKTYILRLPRFYSSLPLLIASASLALTAVYYGVAAVRAVVRQGPEVDIAAVEAAANLFPDHRQGAHE